MKFSAFVRDRAALLFAALISSATIALVLSVSAVNKGILLLVLALMWLPLVFALFIQWRGRVRFWHQVDQALSSPIMAHAIDDVFDQDFYPEAELCVAALAELAHLDYERIQRVQTTADDYHDYIETWVHEIKTPLAAVHLMVDTAQGSSSRQITRELDRLDTYVDQVLYYVRSTTLEYDYLIRKTSLRQLVTASVRSRKAALIETHVAPVLGEGLDEEVFCDPKWIQFILGQLIDNAIKYRSTTARSVPGGQDASVAVACRITFSARRLAQGQARDRVELEIRDNGIGISAADLPRIFDKAFVGHNGRSAERARSTGIGLYLVKSLCTKMGLTVYADSAEGSWTAITLVFPLDLTRYLE